MDKQKIIYSDYLYQFNHRRLLEMDQTKSVVFMVYSIRPFTSHPDVVLGLLEELQKKFLPPESKEKVEFTFKLRTSLSDVGYTPFAEPATTITEKYRLYNQQHPNFGPSGQYHAVGFSSFIKEQGRSKKPVPLIQREPLMAVATFDRGNISPLNLIPTVPDTADVLFLKIPLVRYSGGIPRSHLDYIQSFVEKAMAALDGCLYTITIAPYYLTSEYIAEYITGSTSTDDVLEIEKNQALDRRVRGYGHWKIGLTQGHVDALGGTSALDASGLPYRVKTLGGKTVWEVQTYDNPLQQDSQRRRASRLLFKPIQVYREIPAHYWKQSDNLIGYYMKNHFYDWQLDVPDWLDASDVVCPRCTIPEGLTILEDQ